MKKTLICILVFFTAMPYLALLYLSLVYKWVFPDLIDAQYTLAHWSSLLIEKNEIRNSSFLSLLVSTSLSITATMFGFWMSKFIIMRSQTNAWLSLAFYPYLIAPVVLGAMLQFYFIKLGLSGSLMGVIVAQSFFILPYSVLLFASFWSQNVLATAHQAMTLGATPSQVNKKVLLPMARPWLLLSLIQCFLISWFEYGITQVIGVGKVQTLTIKTMHFIKEANPHLAALSAMTLIIPVLVVFGISYSVLKRKIATW